MLRLEKSRSDKTVRIKILNRLFYLIAVDGLSCEEAARLWHTIIERMQEVLETPEQSAPPESEWYVHYLWWENQKVSVLFMTGDVVSQLERIGKSPQDMLDVLGEFEKSEIHVPFCSANATEGAFAGQDTMLSRISLSTNDESGEITVNTTEEICRVAFLR